MSQKEWIVGRLVGRPRLRMHFIGFYRESCDPDSLGITGLTGISITSLVQSSTCRPRLHVGTLNILYRP